MANYIKGMDISTLKELEALGARYYDEGEELPLLEILKRYDINMIRLRLWHHPYSKEGEAYGGGTNDLETTIALAKRAKEIGFDWLLDIHYSDYWADPTKQFKPKAWARLTIQELEKAVYDYTISVLTTLKEKQIFPDMVQVGNELSNGLLWPEGEFAQSETMTRLINAGIRGVRQVDASLPIMLHLDGGTNNELYRSWFDTFMEKGEDFDIIGLSYYPLWGGKVEGLIDNLTDLAVRYGKELIVAEVAMPFTLEDYAEREGLSGKQRKGMASSPEFAAQMPYPITIEGQAEFMQAFLTQTAEINKFHGFFYWEPAWLPLKGTGWANKASLAYMHSGEPAGNEWANEGLFDYDGNALPAWKVIRDFKAPK